MIPLFVCLFVFLLLLLFCFVFFSLFRRWSGSGGNTQENISKMDQLQTCNGKPCLVRNQWSSECHERLFNIGICSVSLTSSLREMKISTGYDTRK